MSLLPPPLFHTPNLQSPCVCVLVLVYQTMMIFNVKLGIATSFDNLLLSLLLLLFDLIEYSCFVTTVDSRVNAKLLILFYRISTTVA